MKNKIIALQKQLNKLIDDGKPLYKDEVLHISIKLDSLIEKFYRMSMLKNKTKDIQK